VKTEPQLHQILHLLEETGTLNVHDVADRFEVSVVTIRKDLDELESEGLLQQKPGFIWARTPEERIRILIQNARPSSRKPRERTRKKRLGPIWEPKRMGRQTRLRNQPFSDSLDANFCARIIRSR
jgi:DeoR/GlpR family transcriptional regulator of sugar metabolism